MQLGSLLIAKGLITADDVERAVAHHQQNGGRIGDSLVALGFVTANQLVEIMNEVPPSPRTLADTDIDPTFLLQLMLKRQPEPRPNTMRELETTLSALA